MAGDARRQACEITAEYKNYNTLVPWLPAIISSTSFSYTPMLHMAEDVGVSLHRKTMKAPSKNTFSETGHFKTFSN